MPDTSQAGLSHLTFRLGAEEYAVPLSRVAQTVSAEGLTPVPTAPPFIRGLVSVNGAPVPVIDLSRRFGTAAPPHGTHGSVLAVRVAVDGAPALMGLLVERLGRVVSVPERAIEPLTALQALVPAEFLKGSLEKDGAFVLLLDVDRVLTGTEQATLAELAEAEGQADEPVRRDLVPHLAIALAGERCALRISRLRETLPVGRITRLPGAAPDVLGAANVRGTIVPVIDLARRHAVGTTRPLPDSRLVLVEPQADARGTLVAVLVDTIERLAHVPLEEVDRTPPFGTAFPPELVEGMAMIGDDFVPILDLDRALASEAVHAADDAG